MDERSIRIVKWKQIREKVSVVDKILAKIIDDINPSDHYNFVEITYLFGDLIIKEGGLPLLSQDERVWGVENKACLKKAKELLSYQSVPLFLSLENDNEVFIHKESRIIPLNSFNAGALLGVFESVDCLFNTVSHSIWSVSAGVRSIMMLPKITDNINLKKIRAYFEIPATIRLKYLSDHWDIFRVIATNKSFTQPWKNTILFFTKKWLQKDFLEKNFALKNYIFKKAWEQSRFAIGKINSSLTWEKFAEAIFLRNLKPRPYLSDQVKHLLSIAEGRSPGFCAISNAQSAAPIAGLQQAIMEVYGLKKYMPVMMALSPLNSIHNFSPVYYSLSYPTILEGSPLNKGSSTFMMDMGDIKLIIDTFKKHAYQQKLLDHTMRGVEIEYFHSGKNISDGIIPSKVLFDSSQEFNWYKKNYPHLEFPYASSFWNGCFRLTKTVDE